MNILMISRATLFTKPGGDTIQIKNTAKFLNKKKNINVYIKTVNEQIDYSKYDLLHLFNICRPSDLLGIIKKSNLPFVISTVFVDFSEAERNHYQKFRRFLNSIFSVDQLEYLKSVGRFLRKQEKITSLNYFLLGQKKSIKYIIKKAELLLPNSFSEYNRLSKSYKIEKEYQVIPNSIDTNIFKENTLYGAEYEKYRDCIISVGQITPVKNQLNLIRALNNTVYDLYIIGDPTNNAVDYFNECKRIACNNIHFIRNLDQKDLSIIYQLAKVHILASWFETTGLVSLEAAYLGCNIVITNKGDQYEYFKDYAFYCNPNDVNSILLAVNKAYNTTYDVNIKRYILDNYTWDITAEKTVTAYNKVLKKENN